MWATFSRVGFLVLLVSHIAALDANQTSTDVAAAGSEIGVAAAGSQGSSASSSRRAAAIAQRGYRVNPTIRTLAGTPIPNEYIVIFDTGVNVRAATAR
ncbi:hypothetical protein COO60DRAFT_18990 [Scenedesmus sp. NREL 46B-D3]|nr:hypothetical protein COO60DRAFT_18990 [Scenedesmus sp. NREL 46B-D3]